MNSLSSISARLAERYEFGRDGFQLSPGPLLDEATTTRLRDAAERVLLGNYETGIPPHSNSGGPHPGAHRPLIESTDPHLADREIARAIRDPRLAAWVAAVTGAARLKVWDVQVMKKYPSASEKTVVGWHQDQRYHDAILAGRSVNLWIALDDVGSDAGPMRFVPGSHLWGKRYRTGFFEHDTDKQRAEMEIPAGAQWEEIVAPLPAGWATLHGQLTLHGSGSCAGNRPRLNIKLSLGVDDFRMLPGKYYATRIDDPEVCPVLWPGA